MRVPITRYGYRRLLRELLHLRRVVRPQVLEDLQEARAYGVKSDNQQYLNARERHVVLQKKIQDIEEKLARCEIVVGRKYYFKKVGFGTVIVIQNIDTGVTCRYELVGPYESDVSAGKLSVESPVGRCLMGRHEGDEVVVYTPAGIRIYRVLSIQI
ncbi:MAG: GreA/GreB family elongation factor [Syntrophobacteraceae bacterium]|jgi:transcription elongation factor GreA|nr:GreA/GreB family elongation factor [Syntrophobacteraceae bacterium]